MNDFAHQQHVCKSCSNTFVGLYCNLCGEKVIEPKERKIQSVIGHLLVASTIVDNKFLKSLWYTVTKPGFLSREYVDGRRVMYMRPLQMFFILNLIYFLFPVLQMFNSSLYTQLHVLPHSKLAQRIVVQMLKKDSMTMAGFELMYNEKTTSLAKLLVVVFVLLASLPLSLIFRKKNRYFTDHVAFSVELTSFNLAVNAIALSVIFAFINMILRITHTSSYGMYLNDLTLTIIFVSTNLYFIFYAARTFYSQRGKRLILKAFAGILGLFVALEVYRFFLFFITIWTM
ncbi:MAG TPA: DUF3667 domain-containing protein [Ohtaekwangia sp.]|uniref:DUF3667 domain-containing protein n=1 Tax=Ohtaekwangia sp. TaxID=2066019 RepID=UPI002F95211A